MKKRKVNISRIFALIALVVSLISLIVGSIGIYQVHSFKSKETFTVQKVKKGDYVYFDGTSLVMCVDVTISNKSYDNLQLDNIKYNDQVFFGDVVSNKVVYSYDTSTVQFNVGRQLTEEQVAYFTSAYGVGQSAPLENAYGYIKENTTEISDASKEAYKSEYELSFNTKKGSNYSNKVGLK